MKANKKIAGKILKSWYISVSKVDVESDFFCSSAPPCLQQISTWVGYGGREI
jgi:hypothetical protein